MQQPYSTIQSVGTIHVEKKTKLVALSKAIAFIKKDAKVSLSYKLQFAFQFLQIFLSVAVIYFIGRMLSHTGKSPMLSEYGADYFSFALVGLAINNYLKAGLVNITNDIRQTMDQGVLEAMFASPTGYTQLLLYSSIWQFIFETIRAIFCFAVAITIFGMKLNHINWLGTMVSISLTIPIFLMLGVISCSILIIIKRGDPINWIFSGLGALLAGTMFPIKVLPSWLQIVALCLPLTHALEALRKCLLTGAGITQVRKNILALLTFVLVLLPLTVLVANICMKLSKKEGAFAKH